MITRWKFDTGWPMNKMAGILISEDGQYVLHSDYLKLKEALRSALDGWALADNLSLDSDFIRKRRKEFDL